MDLYAEVLCTRFIPPDHTRRNHALPHSPHGSACDVPCKPGGSPVKANDASTAAQNTQSAQRPMPSSTTGPLHTSANNAPRTHWTCPATPRPNIPTRLPRRSSYCPFPNDSGRTGTLWCPPPPRGYPSIRQERPIHMYVCNTKTSNYCPASTHLPIPLHVEHERN